MMIYISMCQFSPLNYPKIFFSANWASIFTSHSRNSWEFLLYLLWGCLYVYCYKKVKSYFITHFTFMLLASGLYACPYFLIWIPHYNLLDLLERQKGQNSVNFWGDGCTARHSHPFSVLVNKISGREFVSPQAYQ